MKYLPEMLVGCDSDGGVCEQYHRPEGIHPSQGTSTGQRPCQSGLAVNPIIPAEGDFRRKLYAALETIKAVREAKDDAADSKLRF